MRNRKPRVYISGRMTGLPKKDYEQMFREAEERLGKDYRVFNPARWGWFLGHMPYRFVLAFDMMMMCFCDRVYFLSGWSMSGGACAEHQFARSVGMIVEYER